MGLARLAPTWIYNLRYMHHRKSIGISICQESYSAIAVSTQWTSVTETQPWWCKQKISQNYICPKCLGLTVSCFHFCCVKISLHIARTLTSGIPLTYTRNLSANYQNKLGYQQGTNDPYSLDTDSDNNTAWCSNKWCVYLGLRIHSVNTDKGQITDKILQLLKPMPIMQICSYCDHSILQCNAFY